MNMIRHGSIRNSTSSSSVSIPEPVSSKKPTSTSSFIVQTTSFPEKTNEKFDRRIRRWNNIHVDRTDGIDVPMRPRRYPLTSTSSTGFQVLTSNNETPRSSFTPMDEQKPINDREESPLPVVETPVYPPLPPKKPPRTFEAEHQKVPSSSSSNNSNSPTFDLGM
jgi:hypothetical protein